MASSLYQNPFYQAITSLGSIMTPDPRAEAEAMRYAQDILTGRAQADKYTEETTGLRAYREGRDALAQSYRNGGSVNDIYANSVLAGEGYYGNTPKVYSGFYSAGDNVDQGKLADIVVGAGGNFGNTRIGFGMDQARMAAASAAADATNRYGHDKDFEASIFGHNKQAETSITNNKLNNQTTARGQDIAADVDRRGQDITAQTSIDNNILDNQTQRFGYTTQAETELEKAMATPETIMRNGVPTIVRRSNAYGQPGLISETQARGDIYGEMRKDPTKRDELGAILAAGDGRSPAANKPPELTPQEVTAMLELLPSVIPGGAEVVANMPPEFRNQIISEVAREYQRTGDYATAVSSVMSRVQPGNDGWLWDDPWAMAPGAAPAPATSSGTPVPPPPPGFRITTP